MPVMQAQLPMEQIVHGLVQMNVTTGGLTGMIQQASASPTVQHLLHSVSSVVQNMEVLSSSFGSQLTHMGVETSSTEQLAGQIGTAMGDFFSNLGMETTSKSTTALAATIATSTIVVSSHTVHVNRRGFVEGRDLPLHYDAEIIAAYFQRKPMDIMLRSAKIMFECSSLTFSILWDKYIGREQEMEKLRATQLVELMARLGPTAIKVDFQHLVIQRPLNFSTQKLLIGSNHMHEHIRIKVLHSNWR